MSQEVDDPVETRSFLRQNSALCAGRIKNADFKYFSTIQREPMGLAGVTPPTR